MEIEEKSGIVDLLYKEEDTKGKTLSELYEEAVKDIRQEFIDSKSTEKSDFISEWADSHVEIYTSEIFKWYYDHSNLFYFVDDAVKEFGWDKDAGIIKALQMGMYSLLEQFAYEALEGD